ncbi:MAG: hypothetical protein V4805_07760 [Pseudomonadota bacterium]
MKIGSGRINFQSPSRAKTTALYAQYFSMRLEPEAFRALAQLLVAAQGRIDNMANTFHGPAEHASLGNIDPYSRGTIH